MWLNALVLAGVIILLASPGGSASAKETAFAYAKIDADRCSHTHGTEVEVQGICRHRRAIERKRSAHACQFWSKSRDGDRGQRDFRAIQRFL